MAGMLAAGCGGGGGAGSSDILNEAFFALPNSVRLAPADSEALLINPGKGWVLYGDFDLKDEAAWDYVSTCYKRYTWASIQPAADTWDWSIVDRDLALCKARGKQFAFGVIPANSLSTEVTMPAWVYAAGAQSYTGKDGRTYPVWDDPVYLNAQAQLTRKLAERFDGSEDIAYIDARNYGDFGEWHLTDIGGPVPSAAVQQQLLRQWQVFTQTWIMVPGDSSTTHVQYGTSTLGYGIRYDSSDYAELPKAGALAMDVAPAVSEWSTRYAALKVGGGWTRQVWSDAWIPTYMAGSGYSYDNLGQWGTDTNLFLSEKSALARTWANRMGYWFRVPGVAVSSHLGNGQSATLHLRVRNDGVAPIYVNRKGSVAKLALLDANNQVLGAPVTLPNVRPFDWKPGTFTDIATSFSFPATAGAARLAIGLFSNAAKASPDIRFGSEGATPAGWLVIGNAP